MSCSHPTSIVCVFRAKKIMVLLSSVCVICTTYKHSRAPFSLHLNPPLFHLCLSKLTLLSPCFSLLAFPPPHVSFCCQYVAGSRVQGHSFPSLKFGLSPLLRFLSLFPNSTNRQKKPPKQNKTKKNPNPHSWVFRVPFIP